MFVRPTNHVVWKPALGCRKKNGPLFRKYALKRKKAQLNELRQTVLSYFFGLLLFVTFLFYYSIFEGVFYCAHLMCKESIKTRYNDPYNQKTSPIEQWPHIE